MALIEIDERDQSYYDSNSQDADDRYDFCYIEATKHPPVKCR